MLNVENTPIGRATSKEKPLSFNNRSKPTKGMSTLGDGFLKPKKKKTKKAILTPKFSSNNISAKVNKPKKKKKG